MGSFLLVSRKSGPSSTGPSLTMEAAEDLLADRVMELFPEDKLAIIFEGIFMIMFFAVLLLLLLLLLLLELMLLLDGGDEVESGEEMRFLISAVDPELTNAAVLTYVAASEGLRGGRGGPVEVGFR